MKKDRTTNDYAAMDKARQKWLRELGQKEPLAVAAYARGFFDALEVALRDEIDEQARNMARAAAIGIGVGPIKKP